MEPNATLLTLKGEIDKLRAEINYLSNLISVKAQDWSTAQFTAYNGDLSAKRTELSKLLKKAERVLKLKKPARI